MRDCLLIWALLVIALIFPSGRCFNHWVVTEDGKIEHQVSSPFNLRQSFDLMAFIQQEERVSILKDLKDELIDYKHEFEHYSEFDSFDESYRAQDPECRDVKLISSYDLYVSTVLPLKHKGIDFTEHLIPVNKLPPAEPHCTISPLNFSMYAMEHLEGVQGRRGLVAPPERSVLTSVDMRMEVFGSLVHHALEKNSTSWVLLNLATLYWRARGIPLHAIECIRRSLHYSPYENTEIALLNLANILHRSHHSSEAATALRVAINHVPSTTVLHFTLGNVYAALEQLNDSVSSFKICRQLDLSCEMSREMYYAALCELRMEEASRDRTEKLDNTQRKLDMFYKKMNLVRKHQNQEGVVEISKVDTEGIWTKEKMESESDDEVEYVDAIPVQDPNLDGMDPDSGEGLDLELALDEALRRDSDLDSTVTTADQVNSSDGEVRRTRSNFRLVLKPLPPDELQGGANDNTAGQDEAVGYQGEGEVGGQELQCPHEGSLLFQFPRNCWENLHPGTHQDPDVGVAGSDVTESDGVSPTADVRESELLIFEQIEHDIKPPKSTTPTQKLAPHKEYPHNYHSLEFLPYNPLPDQLEAAIFPKQPNVPLPLYHDPYWPRKRECLELVKEMKGNPHIVSYMGTFITPEARGASVKELFLSIPLDLTSELRRRPFCPDVVDLPHSMETMDHLEPIMYRANFRRNPNLGERGLRKVLINVASRGLEVPLTFEESAERVYAAMMQNEPNWILFSIASLYWRVKGDPTNSIECLRRSVHFAPRHAKDVGYVGLANVLLRNGYMREAVIMARAALDISENSPVAHYTLAHIYLGLRDYVAASLHLRAALHTQPVFSYAMIALEMVQCSLKFKEEKRFLRQKMKEEEQAMLRQQEIEIMKKLKDAMKSGKKLEKQSQPAVVIENKEPPDIPEMVIGEMVESGFTGEDAVRYLARLSLASRKERGGEQRGGRGGGGGRSGREESGRVEGRRDMEAGEMEGEGGKEEGGGMEKKEGEGRDGEVVGEEREGEERQMKEGGEGGEMEGEGEKDKGKEGEDEEIEAMEIGGEDSVGADEKPPGADTVKKRRQRRKEPSKPPPPHSLTMEEQLAAAYREIERDTLRVVKEAAAALNRNETPVRREMKAYIIPGNRGGVASHGTLPRQHEATPTHGRPSSRPAVEKSNHPSKATPTSQSRIEKSDYPSEAPTSEATPTANIPVAKSDTISDTPPSDKATPTDSEVVPSSEASPQDQTPPTNNAPPTDDVAPIDNAPPTMKGTPIKRPRPPKNRKMKEEEIKKRYPGIRSWPTQEECEEKPLPTTVVFTSTWLSITAKGININDHMDLKSPVDPHLFLPYCHNDFEQSKKTLSHLTGMNSHPLIQYKAEKGLQEVLCTLDGLRRPIDEMATRIKLAMDTDSTSWVLSNVAALYWRIVGQGQLAIKCLKHALYYSDESEREVALVSLANVLYRSGYDIDAAMVIHMSLESSPTLVVNHFTMANILAAQGLFVEAAGFYESTLHYQPEFQPADTRLKTVRCLILAAKKHHKKTKKKQVK